MPPMTHNKTALEAAVLADETLSYHFGMNGGAGPVSKKGWRIINAILSLIAQLEARPAVEDAPTEIPSRAIMTGAHATFTEMMPPLSITELGHMHVYRALEAAVGEAIRLGKAFATPPSTAVEAPQWGLLPISSPEYKAEQQAKNRAVIASLEAVAEQGATGEAELAALAAKHYGMPDSDIPALICWERYRHTQSQIAYMPGLKPLPCFVAGFKARDTIRRQDPPAPAIQAVSEVVLPDVIKLGDDAELRQCARIGGGWPVWAIYVNGKVARGLHEWETELVEMTYRAALSRTATPAQGSDHE